MVIDFEVSCNCYQEKILNFFGFWNYQCPCCGAKHSFTRHGKYLRYLCYVDTNEFVSTQMEILRLICGSCGTTHAILPSGTIPFSYYSIACVIYFLSEFLIEEKSILQIAEALNISPVAIRIYWTRYMVSLISCISFLRVILMASLKTNTSPSEILKILLSNFSPEIFLKEYFIQTNKIFLMTRRRNILSRTLHIGI